MADRKIRFGLISKFEQMCKMHDVNRPAINKYREQWAADALLESFDYDQCIEAMEYYFLINDRPDWSWYCYNMEKLLQSKQMEEEDRQLRAALRAGQRKWLEG